MIEAVISGTVLALLGWLGQSAVRRWIKRHRTARKIEQIRSDVDECAAHYLALTQSGTLNWRILPGDSTTLALQLHTDGILTDQVLTLIRRFLDPAQQANALLTAPPQNGPPKLNEARRMGYLREGRRYVEDCDDNGITLRDEVKAELAAALTKIRRQSL